MDRRTFARTLPAAALSIAGCAQDSQGPTPLPVAPPVTGPPPEYATASDRAFGVVASLLKSARQTNAGTQWNVRTSTGTAQPLELYAGQAGVLAFLAEAYRVRPDETLRQTLEQGGRALRTVPRPAARGLFDGSAGVAWACLSLHEAIGSGTAEWLTAALDLAPHVSQAGGLPGDIINGPPGQGLLLLRLHQASNDTRWLDAARLLADHMLARAVPSHGGIKIPSFNDPGGTPVCYTGLAHGSAGAAYFLCRLSLSLPRNDAARYLDAAEAIATWLAAISLMHNGELHWYRREPDQMTQYQVTWCHGPPGIGLCFAELYQATGRQDYLQLAERCAATVEHGTNPRFFACQCHGIAGNAQLFLRLHGITGERHWLERAAAFGEMTWQRRMPNSYYPAWESGDGVAVDNPGLMTGTAGVGWFYLQLAEGRLPDGPLIP
jgi:lantibiotic modifying enzyme